MDVLKSVWMRFYPLLCVLVPCVVYSVLRCKAEKKKQLGARTVQYFVWTYLFILYLFLAMDVAGTGGLWDIGCYDPVIRLDEINLIPFHSEGSRTYILNALMFMPLGFLLPFIWQPYEKAIDTIGVGAGFSFLIEASQLLNRRQTDIDDLMMNVIGTILGYLLWLAQKKAFRVKGIAHADVPKAEPIVFICLAVLGKFFLYHWRLFDRCFYG